MNTFNLQGFVSYPVSSLDRKILTNHDSINQSIFLVYLVQVFPAVQHIIGAVEVIMLIIPSILQVLQIHLLPLFTFCHPVFFPFASPFSALFSFRTLSLSLPLLSNSFPPFSISPFFLIFHTFSLFSSLIHSFLLFSSLFLSFSLFFTLFHSFSLFSPFPPFSHMVIIFFPLLLSFSLFFTLSPLSPLFPHGT